MITLNSASLAKLQGVNPDLVRVVRRAAAMSSIPFVVTCGLRTVAEQRKLVARGASKTMNSRHLTGHAVDISPVDDVGRVSWDWPLYRKLAPVIKAAAAAEGVAIEWGGDWTKFADGPHWQLPWKRYAANVPAEVAGDKPATERSRTALAANRAVQGSAVAASGGFGLMADSAIALKNQAEQAQAQFQSGTVLGLLVGAVIAGSALYGLYAQWDEAGRPLPDFLARRFPQLGGEA